MKCSLVIGALLALGLGLLLAGCGGGASPTTGLGMISGTVAGGDALAFTADSRAADTATITLDGTNLTTDALPGERFRLRNVPPGLHTLVVRTANRASAVVVGVANGRETDVGDVVLREAGAIAGTVTAKDNGNLLPGAHVVVTEQVLTDTANAMPHPVRVTRTNADGFYALSGLPVGDYLVTIAKPGFETVTLTLAVTTGATTTGDAALPTLPPTERGGMKGIASLKMDDDTLRPLGGVLVRLAPMNALEPERPAPETARDGAGNTVPLYPDRNRLMPPPPPPPGMPVVREYYTYTAEDGSYALEGIPAGNYLAVAVRPGLEGERKPVTIPAGRVLEVHFTLTLRPLRVGVITGTVTNAVAMGIAPTPIAGAWVRAIVGPQPEPAQGLSRMENGSAWGADGVMVGADEYVMYARTDARGQYKLLVPPVVTAIAVDAAGFAPRRVPVTVTAGTTTTADVALQPQSTADVTLTGTVYVSTAAGHAPAPGAMIYAQPVSLDGGVVTLEPAFAAVIYSAKTDDTGAFSLPLKPGPYMLYAEKDALRSERVLHKVFEAGTQDFLLRPNLDPVVPGRP